MPIKNKKEIISDLLKSFFGRNDKISFLFFEKRKR